MKRNTKQLIPMILVFTIIASAYSCRILAMLDIGGAWVNYIRAALYLLLFSLWGYSIDRRIIQTQALHCLRLTAALMLVWLILRTLKYEFVTDLTVARYIWYLYYLPMLFIPLLGVYIALTLGKSEEYRLTERAGFLVAVPGILFLLVITNDLHQQVFAFNSGVPGVPDNYGYSHGIFYFCSMGWMVACMTFSLALLLKKSRVPSGSKKRIRPFVIACITVLYGLLYLSGLPAIRRWLGDMNVTFCLLYAAIYESCIRCRMIPSNTGYVELFEATTLAACIADRSGNIVLRSRAAGEDMVCPREGVPLIRPNGIRISSAPISGGYAIWQDNVRPLTELRAYVAGSETGKEYPSLSRAPLYMAEGQELYAIIPPHDKGTIIVYPSMMTEDGEYADDRNNPLHVGEPGEPLLLRCNLSEIYSNVLIAATDGGGAILFRPSLSMENGHLQEIAGVYDFSTYEEVPDERSIQIATEILLETDEVKQAVMQGMKVMYTGNTQWIEGRPCLLFALGTDSEDQFVRERYYGVCDNLVYSYDAISDTWSTVGRQ